MTNRRGGSVALRRVRSIMLFITSAAAVFGIFAGLILYYSNHPSDTGDISNNPSSQAAVQLSADTDFTINTEEDTP